MRTDRREDGQTAVLLVGFFVVAVLLVVVVVDASAAYLRRQRLDALADGAAIAATDAVPVAAIYQQGVGEALALDPALARRRVADYLRQVGAPADYPGLRVEVSTRGDVVLVEVRTPLDLPFAPPGWAERVTVTGQASARARVVP